MSVFCFNTEYYNSMLEYVIKNKIIPLHQLERHYFNYVLILFAQLFYKEKIVLILNPRLIYCQAANHNRYPHYKIWKDLKIVCTYVKHTYVFSSNTRKMLNKMLIEWRINCTIAPFVKKILKVIKLDTYCTNLYRKHILSKDKTIL